MTTEEALEAVEFLKEDLRDTADFWDITFNDELSERINALANEVDSLPEALIVEYAAALRGERERSGGDELHCSMTMEIGETLDPHNAADVARIYIRAAERSRIDPPSDIGPGMKRFWAEFTLAGTA